MTRFARAEGSKASNKREEEPATPWSQMVVNLRRAGPPERRKNNDPASNGVGKNQRRERLANPEDFDEEDDELLMRQDDDVTVDKEDESSDEDENLTAKEEVIEEKHLPKKVVLEAAPDVPNKDEKKKNNRRKQNKCLNCKQPGHLKKDCPDLPEERRKELQELLAMKIERKGHGIGRKKNKGKNRSLASILADGEANTVTDDGSTPVKNSEPRVKKFKKVLKDKTGQIVAEGEALFQGFRVKAEDVKRLRDLHQQLIKNKVSNEEIKEVLKRERRRAEKALANSKRNVCYNCREPGHMLADCPENERKKNDENKYKISGTATHQELLAGVCFKCGSAEHTSKDCRSKRKGEDAYQFATCFICKQMGHLAKSCPDNPKGLYPKGGGCRFCGSVEHLKSECPRKIEKDSRTEIRVGRQKYNGGSIEDEPEPFTAGCVDDEEGDGPTKAKKKKKMSDGGRKKVAKKTCFILRFLKK